MESETEEEAFREPPASSCEWQARQADKERRAFRAGARFVALCGLVLWMAWAAVAWARKAIRQWKRYHDPA